MDRDELIRRLWGYEWRDIEVKEALRDAPKSAYETVSAFSNTDGGWLVFGVREAGGRFDILGVLEVDKVQNDFLSALSGGQKISKSIVARESLLVEDGKALLLFYIPEAARTDKPVYLDGDIRRSFVRRGGGDYRCTHEELQRFLRDAARERYDGECVPAKLTECFDSAALRWYRAEYDRLRPGELDTLSDEDFLLHWGLIQDQGGQLIPTRASLLLFGAAPVLHQLMPRPVVDFQIIPANRDEEQPAERWSDRIVVEGNLIQAWRAIIERFLRHAEQPFSVDGTTLQRVDRPPDYTAFREAAINLLVHQDYADHTRKASIHIYRDQTVFFNPGDAFAAAEELLDPGEREVRNPRIIAALRRVGLSEQAGTGLRDIYRSWRTLGRVPPIVTNNKARKTFELALTMEDLVSEQQLLLGAQLGVRLDGGEAAVFAYACRKGTLSLLDIRAVTGGSAASARSVADRLATQVLLTPVTSGTAGDRWELASHLQALLNPKQSEVSLVSDPAGQDVTSLVSDQAGPTQPTESEPRRLLLELSETQRRILELCTIPLSMTRLMEQLGVSHRTHFRRQHLEPLVEAKLLTLRHPDSPHHPRQAYQLSPLGLALLERWQGSQRDGG